jgi:hypothetical protein
MNDKNLRGFILFIFFMLIVYFSYIRFLINVKGNWSNLKCNPLYMMIGSLINDIDSQTSFNDCVNATHDETVQSNLIAAQHKVDAVNAGISQTQSVQSTINSVANSNLESAQADIQSGVDNLAELAAKQARINDSLVSTTGGLNGIITSLGTIVSNVKTSANNFKNSQIVKKLKKNYKDD